MSESRTDWTLYPSLSKTSSSKFVKLLLLPAWCKACINATSSCNMIIWDWASKNTYRSHRYWIIVNIFIQKVFPPCEVVWGAEHWMQHVWCDNLSIWFQEWGIEVDFEGQENLCRSRHKQGCRHRTAPRGLPIQAPPLGSNLYIRHKLNAQWIGLTIGWWTLKDDSPLFNHRLTSDHHCNAMSWQSLSITTCDNCDRFLEGI